MNAAREARHAAIANTLSGRVAVVACGHDALAEVAWVCGLHPESGVRCEPCAREHIRDAEGHDYVDVPCDRCAGPTGRYAEMQSGFVDVEGVLRLVSPGGWQATIDGGRVMISPDQVLCMPCAFNDGESLPGSDLSVP